MTDTSRRRFFWRFFDSCDWIDLVCWRVVIGWRRIVGIWIVIISEIWMIIFISSTFISFLKNLRVFSTFLWIREKSRGLWRSSNKTLRILRNYSRLSYIIMNGTWLRHFIWWCGCVLILKISIRRRLMTILIIFLVFFSHCWIFPFIEHPVNLFTPFWDLFTRIKRIRWVIVPSVNIIVTRKIYFFSKVLLSGLRLRGISNTLRILVDRQIRKFWRWINIVCASIVWIIGIISFVRRMLFNRDIVSWIIARRYSSMIHVTGVWVISSCSSLRDRNQLAIVVMIMILMINRI